MTIRTLRTLGITYLALPNILFYTFWTRPVIGAAGIFLLLIAMALDHWSDRTEPRQTIPLRSCLFAGMLAGMITILSGSGGICYQTIDYWSHHVKFYELYANPWPFRLPVNSAVVSYYYGYYVVPALIFKLIGGIHVSVVIVWTCLGIWLGLCWLLTVLNNRLWMIPVVLCTGDLPRVLKHILGKLHVHLYSFNDFGIEHWSVFENLFWVPNQIIPTMIMAGMFVYCIKNKFTIAYLFLPVIFSLWWAIFPSLTMGLLVSILYMKELYDKSFSIMLLFNPFPIICISLCIPFFIFFNSHQHVAAFGTLMSFVTDQFNTFKEYATNILFNAAIFYFVLFRVYKKEKNRFVFRLILLLILLLPGVRIGKVNDFLFRGLMPYLLIIGLCIMKPISEMGIKYFITKYRIYAFIILILLFISTFSGVSRIERAMRINILNNQKDNRAFEPIPFDQYANVYEVLQDRWSQEEADQYLGKPDSCYERIIAPPE